MLIHKRTGAEHPRFFTVGKEQDDILLEWRTSGERTRRFQHRRHRGTVVAGAWAGRHRVIMCREHDRCAGLRPWDAGDDIVYGARLHAVALLDSDRRLHLGIKLEGLQLCDEIVAHARWRVSRSDAARG
jgi:hypothetical protein